MARLGRAQPFPAKVNGRRPQPAGAAGNAITLTTPAAYTTRQRTGDTNGVGGTASIAITGTYTGSPTAVEASWNGGAYATIDAAPAGGTYAGTLTSQPAGQGTLTVRFTNDTGTTATAAYIGVGDVVVCYGQSNMSGRGTSNQSYGAATGLRASLFGNDYVWKELADPYDYNTSQVDTVSSDFSSGSWIPPLATHWMAYTRCPVAFVPAAKGGTGIVAFKAGADHADRTTLYGSMKYRAVTGSGSGGTCRVVIWWQGETDASNDMIAATYAGHMATLAADIAADVGCYLMPCKLQQSPSLTLLQTSRINDGIGTEWADDANVLTGPDFSDITASSPVGDDAYHIVSDAGLAVVAARWWQAAYQELFAPAGGGGSGVSGARIFGGF